LKEYPDSSMSDAARAHINRLDQPATKEFYDWFAKQDPRPPAAENLPGVPGLKPSFNLDESPGASQGDVKLPSALPSGSSRSTPSELGGGSSAAPSSGAPTSGAPSSTAPSSAMPPSAAQAGASK
jgi:hypothetical protein